MIESGTERSKEKERTTEWKMKERENEETKE